MSLGRKVLLDSGPLNQVWLHLARGRRPASAAGVRVLPALDLRSHSTNGAQQLSDARLGLAELVIEPAHLDELFDIRGWHTCTIQMCSRDGNRNGMMAE